MSIANDIRYIATFTDEELLAAYRNILQAQPQEPHYRRARLAILELLEARGRALDRKTAELKRKYNEAHK